MRLATILSLFGAVAVTAFTPSLTVQRTATATATILNLERNDGSEKEDSTNLNRRGFVAAAIATTTGLVTAASSAFAVEVSEDFAAIAARASRLSTVEGDRPATPVFKSDDTRTMYDFSIPVQGVDVSIKDLIHQEYDAEGVAKVKAVLVVNMKQDDPIARKDIPELMSLASKFGRSGEFVVILSPSDQGYYEPDTSTMVRLKLASEYGYGINPATVLTDKVNYLGTGAHPFWRWLQKNCRTPSGLGRIEQNYEKFLLDARTGVPLRRYPRKYTPSSIKNDVEAVVAGRALPPAVANYQESWRSAAVEAERDTYRFQKGLNYFDQ